ncbi:unnamed protein product [Allacma fusca]|uniref:Pseudouridine synthase n=1 Tax=Allacma fusca TaxID=39272 RepID=A0A8J2P5X0_9HEXA|nr:unnamed protein product [Allacma fusca]
MQERCIKSGTLTVNYTKVDTDYRLKHNDLLANIVHRHEVPVTSDPIEVVHMDDDLVVVNKPASIPVHPCGRYRHNTVVFILAKEHQLKNLRTIHRLDRLTSGLLLFGRSPKKAREMEQQIRNRQVSKEYVCRVEGEFPEQEIECCEPIEVVSYKIGVCKVSKDGKDCRTTFKKLSYNGKSSVVIARPRTGRMHQIRVHLQYLGYPIVNDPLYNHVVFGPEKGKGGLIGKTDEQLIADLISIHNAENWLGIEGEESGGPSGDIFGPPRPTPESDNHSSSSCGQSSDMGALKSDITPEGAVDQNSSTLSPEPTATIPPPTPPSSSTSTVSSAISSASPVLVASTTQTPKLGQAEVFPINGKVTVGTQTCEDESPCSSFTNTSTATTNSSSIQNSSMNHGISTATSTAAATTTAVGTASNAPTNTTAPTTTNDPLAFKSEQMTYDPHCYECKVRYRDPKPKDLVMYLHALTYKGPEWSFETKLPEWAGTEWVESDDS